MVTGCRVGKQYPAPSARMYAAAKVNNSTGDWTPVNQNINDLIRSSRKRVVGRVKQLSRDFPFFARGVRCVVDYTVGTGLQHQAKVRDADGNLNKKINQKIEDAFKFWSDECDIRGMQDFYDIQRLAKEQDATDGEFIVVKRLLNDSKRFLPYALQTLSPDLISETGGKAVGDNRIDMGMEYDGNGRRVAIHFDDPDSWGKTMRIPMEHVIHGFDVREPGQLRGMSLFTPGVLLAHDLDDYLSAGIDKAKMQSKWLAFVTTLNPAGKQFGMQTDAAGRKIEELENGIIEYLNPGETIDFNNSNSAADSFKPLATFILRTFAVVADISYELLTGDYDGINYSNLKGIRNDMLKSFRYKQERHRKQLCFPVNRDVIHWAVMNGKLDLPGYWSNPHLYLPAEWADPGVDSLDPLREGKADIDQVNALLKSPQEIIKKRGRDPEQVLNELKEFKEMAEDKGLTMQEVNTSLANNPEALTDEEKADPELMEAYTQNTGTSGVENA